VIHALILLLLIWVGCSAAPPPPQQVWHYPPGLTEAQASAIRAECMRQTAYETDFVFRLVAIENCLRAKGWVKGPPSLTTPPQAAPQRTGPANWAFTDVASVFSA
jgi:hypothetical protein